MSEMSFDDAVNALVDAQEADAGPTPVPAQPAPPAPEQAPTQPTPTPEGETVQPHWSAQQARDEFGQFIRPEGQPEPTEDASENTPDLFQGEQVNPDELIAANPELEPLVRQLQGAFTRKTQELAEQRKQFDGLDPASAREAMELYNALQDPNYLTEFYGEVGTALRERGLLPEEVAALTAEAPTPAAAPAPDAALEAMKADPEMAPIAALLEAQRAELAEFRQEQAAEREAQEMANWQMAMAGEIVRQEAALTKQGFSDQQLDRVHQLAGHFDGNLLEAGAALREIRQEAVRDFLAAKAAVEPGTGPVPGDGSVSEIPSEVETLDDGLKAALGHLAQAGLETFEQ